MSSRTGLPTLPLGPMQHHALHCGGGFPFQVVWVLGVPAARCNVHAGQRPGEIPTGGHRRSARPPPTEDMQWGSDGSVRTCLITGRVRWCTAADEIFNLRTE